MHEAISPELRPEPHAPGVLRLGPDRPANIREDYAVSEGTKPRGRPFAPGNPGRPKGSRNKLAESFLDVLYRDWETNGEAAIAAAREESPLGYVKVVASLLPTKVEVEHDVSRMTDEELLAIARRGRPGPAHAEIDPPRPNGVVH